MKIEFVILQGINYLNSEENGKKGRGRWCKESPARKKSEKEIFYNVLFK